MKIEEEREHTEDEVEQERTDALVASLTREGDGYRVRGLNDRAAQVEAQIRQLGTAKPEPEEREQTAPMETAVDSKPRRTTGRAGK